MADVPVEPSTGDGQSPIHRSESAGQIRQSPDVKSSLSKSGKSSSLSI